MSRNQELKDALGELLGARRDLGSHPDPEELAAYHDGELSAERQRQIQDHLVACHECARLLLDLNGLTDPDFGAGVGLEGKEAVWQRLREETPAGSLVVPIRQPAPSAPRWLQALAASLLVATLGLSLWVASLRRTVRELAEPEPNAVVRDLNSGTARGAGSPRSVTTVPSEARSFILILTPRQQRRDEYRVVIERSTGGAVWSGRLEPNEVGSLTLRLSRRALPPGDYQVRLLGEGSEPIEKYALRIESP
ncbi:MAG TPA: zf-HC2 domain-containing protein [Thermoanaerobaculia bacterium]|jgi:hypothetical protein|nr:zf-HC2 domain-containing protein [Thermoanaerobaculia bacterium]